MYINWKVVSDIGGVRESAVFGESKKPEAVDLYNLLKLSLEEENDRVVLYRIKGGPFGRYYQDAYRTSLMGRDGNVVSVLGAAPRDWRRAEIRRARPHFPRRPSGALVDRLTPEDMDSIKGLADIELTVQGKAREDHMERSEEYDKKLDVWREETKSLRQELADEGQRFYGYSYDSPLEVKEEEEE